MGIITSNIFWKFFKSVKLALFNFFTLAITSIIGTVIQQNEAPVVYVREYGVTAAKLFHILGITDMYHAWWFIALLILFSINLIVCSLNRFPDTWRLVIMDNLAIGTSRPHAITGLSHLWTGSTRIGSSPGKRISGCRLEIPKGHAGREDAVCDPEGRLDPARGLHGTSEYFSYLYRGNNRFALRLQSKRGSANEFRH